MLQNMREHEKRLHYFMTDKILEEETDMSFLIFSATRKYAVQSSASANMKHTSELKNPNIYILPGSSLHASSPFPIPNCYYHYLH